MPFGYNFIQKLLDENNSVDFYLGQDKDSLSKDFIKSNKFKINYVTNKRLWKSGIGRKQHFYFLFLFLRNLKVEKYDAIVGMGLLGCAMAGMLKAKYNKKLILLNDEYPNIYYSTNWIKLHNNAAQNADLIILPCISRKEEFLEQTSASSNKLIIELPNTLLKRQVQNISYNWEKEIKLDSNCKYILYSGGTNDFNYFYESYILSSFLPANYKIIFIGGKEHIKNDEFLKRNNVIWVENYLDDSEYNGLMKKVDFVLALYKNICYLDTVGKSSGKIMRAICLGTDVIVNGYDCYNFSEDNKLGLTINRISELNGKLKNAPISERVLSNEYFYDTYWEQMTVGEL